MNAAIKLAILALPLSKSDILDLHRALPLLISSANSKMLDCSGDIGAVLSFGDSLLHRLEIPDEIALAIEHRMSVVDFTSSIDQAVSIIEHTRYRPGKHRTPLEPSNLIRAELSIHGSLEAVHEACYAHRALMSAAQLTELAERVAILGETSVDALAVLSALKKKRRMVGFVRQLLSLTRDRSKFEASVTAFLLEIETVQLIVFAASLPLDELADFALDAWRVTKSLSLAVYELESRINHNHVKINSSRRKPAFEDLNYLKSERSLTVGRLLVAQTILDIALYALRARPGIRTDASSHFQTTWRTYRKTYLKMDNLSTAVETALTVGDAKRLCELVRKQRKNRIALALVLLNFGKLLEECMTKLVMSP
jgi:hypothetical protein